MGNNATDGVICIIIACSLWATTGTAANLAPSISPLAIGAFAMGVAGLLLLITASKTVIKERAKLSKVPVLLVLGGISIAIYPLAFYSSMKFAGVAIGTVVSLASAPFFSIVFERLINKKSISLRWTISFIFGVVGVTLIAMGKQVHGQPTLVNNSEYLGLSTMHFGVILGLIAGLSYAVYAWAAKQMIDQGISSNASMASMFGFASVLLLPSLLITGDNLFATPTNTAVSIYMAVVPMFIGYLLFGYGLRHIEASKATLITLLEPVLATLLAVIVVGEKFNSWGWLGMVLILVCLVLQIVKVPMKLGGRLTV
ncbi:EamA family transporter [uncultured Paraglaciecola sp.]|uniref:DMT family transporter n=1 Tax=uncultured Paraglaciecola sp. TaxID=1765024 RepID=UPI00259A9E04|nr:EamA family transporter [uncultured Paraglaciecola sp.]